MYIFTSLFRLTFASLCLFLLFPQSSYSQCAQADGTIVVYSAADEGLGTLRDAINCANLDTRPNRIVFNIPSVGQAIILVGSTSGLPLPALVNPGTVIDGSTQTGFGTSGDFSPKIVLDGAIPAWSLPIDALKIHGNEAAIYALEIRNFPDDGIDIDGADRVIIGDIDRGNVIYNCGWEQDIFPNANPTGPWDGVGIVLDNNADNCEIINNIIGTNSNNNAGLGNEWCGIYIRNGSDFALIEGNTIASNEVGIRLRNVFGVRMTENALFCNEAGIALIDGANDDKIAPTINTASNLSISGTGNLGDEVEVFVQDDCANSSCQGAIFLGRVIVQNDRTWRLTAPYINNYNLNAGRLVTATATDNNGRTSAYGNCSNAIFEVNCASSDGVIMVTNTNDEGAGSLRAAIECANETEGPNTIRFNISGGGRQQINVGSTTGAELPVIRDAYTIIDATTQPGFGANGNFQPMIILDGAFNTWTFPHNAVWVRADYCEIYGLEIRNFPDDGIDITGGDFNIIGAANRGNVIYNCGSETDFFKDAPNTGPWNGCGIVLKGGSQNCIISGNTIGTDYFQSTSIGNEFCGIIIQSGGNNNRIGGELPGEGNLIVNNLIGVRINGNAYYNRINNNTFSCNSALGIQLSSDANFNHASPIINTATDTEINGTATDGDIIEVYAISSNCLNGPCQGAILLGRTQVTNQTWSIGIPFFNGVTLADGDQVTALATDNTNNTSQFSDCQSVVITDLPNICDITLGISNFSNETCAGNDGMFTLSVTGATLPISYDYGIGATSNSTFSNLSAGVYSVTATDAEGCNQSLNVVISEQSSPVLNIVNSTNENCGQGNGSITLAATGGRAPYAYNIGTGTTANTTFNNLTAGNYVVTVTDFNGCTATQTATIQTTGNISVAVTEMRNESCNLANGSFRLAASGGIAPYSYNIGSGTITEPIFRNLTSGNYAVTVVDANNCSTVANVSINGTSAPVLSIGNLTPASCNQATGSVSINVSGGTTPYQYNIGNGNVLASTFSNLNAGNYVITVTDANNCTASQSFSIDEPQSPVLSIVAQENASCGNANGAVSLLATGGQAPYTYDIGNGPTSNSTFNNLSQGNYSITVTDNGGCTNTQSLVIENTPTPTISIENIQDASCNLNNGVIRLSGINGLAPYTFDIGNGPVSNSTFTDLAPGNHSITMTDNNGCSASVNIALESTGGPQLNIVSTSEAKCDRANGSFVVSPIGGIAPYTYDIGNGPTDSPEFSNLAGGNYVVTLTDVNGCTATQSVTLGNVPTPNFGIGNIIPATCGEANGGFSVSAFGGTPPYRFNIGGNSTTESDFNNLIAGIYTVVVTDANNCSKALAVTIDGTDAPEVAVASNSPENCGAADGSFSLEVSGGTAPYIYDIGDGPTSSPDFSNLQAGDYVVTITDNGNCSLSRNITVGGSSGINLTIKDPLPAACNQANGSFKLSPSGGTAPYTFSLNQNNSTDSVFSNLNAGTYTISTTDALGCSAVTEVSIAESEGLVLSLEVSQECGNPQAEILAVAAQGTAPYTYDIGNGPTTNPSFTGLSTGLYQIKAIDANGCESARSIAISTSTDAPEAVINAVTPASCGGGTDGSFVVDVTKGIPPYLYAISDKEKSPFPNFSNLSAGDYLITITDAGGCSSTLPVTIGGGNAAPIANFNFAIDELNTAFTNNSREGATYEWDFGDGNSSSDETPSHAFRDGGSYAVCLTATNACGSDTHCETITIEAVNANKSFEFDFGEVNGSVGDTLKVPVYVKNFRDIVGFQKSVHIVDTSVARVIEVSDFNLDGLSAGLFGIKNHFITVSWIDNLVEGITLPDSTIIYTIAIQLLADGKCTDLVIKEDPVALEVAQKIGDDEVAVSSFNRKGNVCTLGGATADIRGLVYTEDHSPIGEVRVYCSNAETIITDISGTYRFEDMPTAKKYILSPKKDQNPLNGITTFDLVIIQNHILGKAELESPYKLIAADVNKSGSVTIADVLELQRLLLFDLSDFTNNESWRFVDADYVFSNPLKPFSDNFPETKTIDLAGKIDNADFIGIKIGDVNNSVFPDMFASSENRNNEFFKLYTEDHYLEKGELADITFSASDLTQILGFQYTMQFNSDYLEVQHLTETSLMDKSDFGQSFLQRGYLLSSWVNTASGTSENPSLFTLTIKAKKAGQLSDLLQINDAFLKAEAYNSEGKTLPLQLYFEKNHSDKFQLFQNKPNPFAQFTVINYLLPKDARVQLNLFDVQGKLLKTVQQNGQKGMNKIAIQRAELATNGIFYYQINTPFGQETKKMLVLDK